MKKINLVYLAILLTTSQSLAAEYTFNSQIDSFTVSVSDGGVTYNNTPVSAEPFVFISPLFKTDLIEICANNLGRPDLTITRKMNASEIKRIIYFDKKIISDGTKCGFIDGHGLYQLPLHRNWFEGKSKMTIALEPSFSIIKEGKVVVSFAKKDETWKNQDKKFFTNWKFFNEFIDALTNFTVDFRVHPAAARKFSTFQIKQGNKIFNFVKVGDLTWAVQYPGSPWYAASGQFGIFEDMSQNIWRSPYAKTLEVLADITAPTDMRIKAIRELSETWGSDLTHVMQEVLLTGGDALELKKEIVSLLRKRPTNENFKILVDALRVAEDDTDYLNFLTKALRVRNPKGPVVNLDDNNEIIKSKIQTWISWRKSL